MTLLSELHIFTLYVFRLVVVSIVHDDAEFIQLIEAIVRVLVAFSLLVIALSSLFVMAFVYELIWHIWVNTGVVVVTEHVFE